MRFSLLIGVVALFAANSGAAQVPDEWTCPDSFYDVDDGCDCGCGALDPDCSDATFDSCQFDGCGLDLVPSQPDPTACVANVCGDATSDGEEDCDDNNTNNGDGCNSACEEEENFDCTRVTIGGVRPGLQSVCLPVVCGDLVVNGGENCDDDNNTAGDGCDASCEEEDNFFCPVDGNVGGACRQIVCGDGFSDFPESCDDDNNAAGDGCDAACEEEAGFTCETEGQPCRPIVCGDGFADFDFINFEDSEACDDGNTNSGDGCSAECEEETGFVCATEGEACRPIVCGDGFADFDPIEFTAEECDDANPDAGDGCSDTCEEEDGFVCDTVGEPCRPIVCGDSIIDRSFGDPASETCDDGNDVAADGCDAACLLEPGFICEEAGEPCRPTVCGDELIEGAEDCEDGNAVAGDGCSALCQAEEGFSCNDIGEPCIEIPDGWNCTESFFASDDGCDCGCGVTDPDCPAAATIDDCFSPSPSVCDGGTVDPADITKCIDGPAEGEGEEGEGEGEGEEGEGEGGGGNEGEGEDDGPTPKTGCAATPMVTTSTAMLLAALALVNRRRRF